VHISATSHILFPLLNCWLRFRDSAIGSTSAFGYELNREINRLNRCTYIEKLSPQIAPQIDPRRASDAGLTSQQRFHAVTRQRTIKRAAKEVVTFPANRVVEDERFWREGSVGFRYYVFSVELVLFSKSVYALEHRSNPGVTFYRQSHKLSSDIGYAEQHERCRSEQEGQYLA
jgi:hypothetical protein